MSVRNIIISNVILLMIVFMCTVSGCHNDGDQTITDIFQDSFYPMILKPTCEIHPGDPGDYARYCRRGWSDPEQEAAWVKDKTARCIFHVPVPRTIECVMDLRSLCSLGTPQVMTVSVGETRVATLNLKEIFQEHRFTIDRNLLEPGWNTMTFQCSRIDTPESLGLSRDRRTLAAFIRAIKFKPNLPLPDDSNDQPDIEFPEKYAVLKPGTVYRMIVPAKDNAVLTLNLKSNSEKPAQALLTVRQDGAIDAHGPALIIRKSWDIPVREKRFRVSINPENSEPIRILLENNGLEDVGFRGEYQERITVPDPWRELTEDIPAQNLPDHLFVAVPDALAPSFPGACGNPDAYTPFMDRMARTGDQWSAVHSTASYTVTSVAGMLSGTYPGEHGVSGIGDRLNARLNLVSSRFARQGYRTHAVSGMPTVSSLWGFARDFDQFHELSRMTTEPVSGRDLLDHVLLSMDDYLESRSFVYLHFREPHSPYHPPRPFDRLWGETDSGFGTIEGLRDLDRTGGRADPGTVSTVRNLYRGQVAFVDRLLEDLYFEICRRLPRDSDFAFMVISDHGEAFGEHGRFEHNSTVYGEMVGVPVIRGTGPQENKTGHIHPQPGSNRDMYNMLMNPQNPPGTQEPIWHRSAGNDHYLTGVRLGDWHYIEGGYYVSRELYHLVSDPGETVNRIHDFPVMADWLQSKMLSISGTRQQTGEPTVPIPLDQDTESRLRALGYLD